MKKLVNDWRVLNQMLGLLRSQYSIIFEYLVVGTGLTLPSRFADRFDVNAHQGALCRPLLATVHRRHHDVVLLLSIIAELLCVSDVT